MNHSPAPRVEILLATRNSTDYLAQMLESLATQSFRDFHLVVSDDMSSDGTLEMIRAHQSAFQNPVQIIARTTRSGSAQANFASLLEGSTGDYVFLADHDDIWLPEKVETAMARIRAIEAERGVNVPVMTHCNLRVINGAGDPVAPSYWDFKSIDPRAGQHLNTALVHATVTGCAMAMNRALVAQVGTIPPQTVMHDWWINLTAAAFGVVDYDPEPRILYRIHGRNASRPRQVSLVHSLFQLDRFRRMRVILNQRFTQGRAFRDAYAADLPEAARRTLDLFASIPGADPLTRRVRLLRGRFFWPGLWRNIASFACI